MQLIFKGNSQFFLHSRYTA